MPRFYEISDILFAMLAHMEPSPCLPGRAGSVQQGSGSVNVMSPKSSFSLCRFCLSLALLGAAGLSPAPAVAAGPAAHYTPVPLGIIDNAGSSTVLHRVNVHNEVVGAYRGGKAKQVLTAFLLSANNFDPIADMQATDSSVSYGINDSGEIAGVFNGPVSQMPFRSVRHTGFQVLPLLAGDVGGAAYGINNQGESVGFSTGANGAHAAWWTRAGKISELPGLPESEVAKAVAINNGGDIVGNAGEGSLTAVLWPKKSSAIPLDTLATYTSSRAESINDKGDVVGSATAYDGTAARIRAVLWPAGYTAPQDLGVLSGGTTSRARDIDNKGIVVGTSESDQGNRAFVWSANTGMVDLNTLSTDPTLVLVDALSVNANGAILAIGINVADAPPMHAMHTMVATSHTEERELPRHIVLLTPVK